MALPQKGHPCLTVFRLPQLLSINHKKRQPETLVTRFRLPPWRMPFKYSPLGGF